MYLPLQDCVRYALSATKALCFIIIYNEVGVLGSSCYFNWSSVTYLSVYVYR